MSHLSELFRAADTVLLDLSPTAPSGSGETKVLVPISRDCRRAWGVGFSALQL